MSFEADMLVDRRRLKRRLSLWRAAAVLALVGLIVFMIGGPRVLSGRDHIARLNVEGLILEDEKRDELLGKLAMDDAVKALIVRIDSPGGTVVGGETLYSSLRGVSAHKPVVIVMGTTATSAGYMVALGGDMILAREGTVTGSIGVILQSADVTGLLKKLGVDMEAIKSAPLKATPSPFEPLTQEAREAAKVVIMDMFNMFVTLVAERRNMPKDRVLPLADGRIFTGRQAREANLVDAIGGENEALAWLETERGVARGLPVREIKVREDDELLSGAVAALTGKTKLIERLTLDGLVSLWHFDAGRP
ncbi:MAG: signal peptide peptidase SppA [Alphaproteobacteria bacterium]